MKISKTKSGLIIGTLFTVCSLLLTGTFVVPIISVLPGMLFETIAENCIGTHPYSNVGIVTIIFLAITLVLTLILCMLKIMNKRDKGEETSNARIVGIFSLIYFLVHPLGFYIRWGISSDFESDGQLILGAIISYPISSCLFIFIGILIDFVKNQSLEKRVSAAT